MHSRYTYWTKLIWPPSRPGQLPTLKFSKGCWHSKVVTEVPYLSDDCTEAGADPGLLDSQPWGAVSHKPSSRLPLFSARPFPATEHHRFTSTKSYCLVTDAHACQQLARGRWESVPDRKSNQWPKKHKSNAPLTAPPHSCQPYANLSLNFTN